MTATNHMLSGAIIGALLPLPIAIPVAIVSHFALDALPHYGIAQNKRNRSLSYRLILIVDALATIGLGILMAATHHYAMLIGGLAAYSPDAAWIITYFKNGHNLHFRPRQGWQKSHQDIQRYERPWGIYVETGLAAVMLAALSGRI